jgi:hypothetical protein
MDPLTPEQQARLIDWFFSKDGPHPEICGDQYNADLIAEFLKTHTMGPEYMNRAALEFAVKSLAGQLHYYAGADVSQQLAAGAQAQAALQEAEEAAERARRAAAHQARLQAEQDARRPGVASAYEGAAERDAEDAKKRADAQTAERNAAERTAMLAELRKINQHLVTNMNQQIVHGRTNQERAEMKAKLRAKYPRLAAEII